MKIKYTLVFFVSIIVFSSICVSLRSLCIQDRYAFKMCSDELMRQDRVKWQKENTVWEKEPLCIKLWKKLDACGKVSN